MIVLMVILSLWPVTFLVNIWVIKRAFAVIYQHPSPNDDMAIILVSSAPIAGCIAAAGAWLEARAIKARLTPPAGAPQGYSRLRIEADSFEASARAARSSYSSARRSREDRSSASV